MLRIALILPLLGLLGACGTTTTADPQLIAHRNLAQLCDGSGDYNLTLETHVSDSRRREWIRSGCPDAQSGWVVEVEGLVDVRADIGSPQGSDDYPFRASRIKGKIKERVVIENRNEGLLGLLPGIRYTADLKVGTR